MIGFLRALPGELHRAVRGLAHHRGFAAALVPAHRAARLDPREALESE
jgi:ABC-type lipoprotein release transport system permease subunit